MPRLVLLIASALVASAIVAGCGAGGYETNGDRRADPGSSEATFRTVTIDDVADEITAGDVLLVDVRTQPEWDEGRAAQAMHVPLAEVEDDIDEIREESDGRPVAFICRSGRRSAEAAAMAASAGVEDVSSIDGGMQAWVDEGLALEPPNGRIAS